MKTSSEWTREELEALPLRGYGEDIGEFDSLIILPTSRIHDSGYRMMDFVAEKMGVPFYRLSGWSDVIHFDGIGGLGFNWLNKYGTVPNLVKPKDWNIDCLRTSGLLRIFTHKKLIAGDALSSFELYSE